MRLELTKRTDLAIRALHVLCESGAETRVAGARLADQIGTTTNYLSQVMTPLVRRLWVESVSGPQGGYVLRLPLVEISLLEIIEAVEGPVDGRCVLRGAPCPVVEWCALHVPWIRARDALLSELSDTPVAEMDCSARQEEDADVA
jgi:Rrf2 family protein